MPPSAGTPGRWDGTAASPNRSPVTRRRQSSRATENLPGSFTNAVSHKIKMATDERCFMCDHRGHEGAHVVGKSDKSVRILAFGALLIQ